jgi:MSHA biogenesis protein MshO
MKARRIGGFTLVELVMVIMVTGIIAASVTVFLKPAIDSYVDTRRRGDLTDMADTAVRRISQDIRSAVPNSVRMVPLANCIQLVPTIAGGRYRMAPDTTVATSKWIDTSAETPEFDVLSPLWDIANPPVPLPVQVNDWVVIDNQNGDEVYLPITNSHSNRTQITQVDTPPPVATGVHRLSINHRQFPIGYDRGRFVVVRNTETTIYYSCTGGTLYRGTTSNFATVDAAACSAATGAAIVATGVNCAIDHTFFVYSSNQGATQQSGFVWMRIELGDSSGESVALAHGVHVDNVP